MYTLSCRIYSTRGAGTRRFSFSLTGTADTTLPIPSTSNTTTSILTQPTKPVKPTSTSQYVDPYTTDTNVTSNTATNNNSNTNNSILSKQVPVIQRNSENRRMSVIKTDKPKLYTTSTNHHSATTTTTTNNNTNNNITQSTCTSLASTLSTTIHSEVSQNSGSGPAILHSQLSIEIIKNMSSDSYWNNRLKLFEMINNKLNTSTSNTTTTTSTTTTTAAADNNTNSINTTTIQRSGIFAYFSSTIFDLIIETAMTHISDLHHKVALEAIYTIHLCMIYYNIYHTYIDNKLDVILITLFNRLSDRRQVVKDHTNNILILIRDTIPPVIIMTALSPKINEVNERMKTPMIVYINTLIPLCTDYFIQYTYTYTFLTRICYIIQPTSTNTKPTNTLLIQINKTLILLYQTSPISVRTGIANLSLSNQLIVKRMLSTHVPDIDSLVTQAGRGQEQWNSTNTSNNKISSTNNSNNSTTSVTTAATSTHNNSNQSVPVMAVVVSPSDVSIHSSRTTTYNGKVESYTTSSKSPVLTTTTSANDAVYTLPIQSSEQVHTNTTQCNTTHDNIQSPSYKYTSPVNENKNSSKVISPVHMNESNSNTTPTLLVLEEQDKCDSDEGYDVRSPADLNLTIGVAPKSLNRQEIVTNDNINTLPLRASPRLTSSPAVSVSAAATDVRPTSLSYTPYSTPTQLSQTQTQTVTSPLQQRQQVDRLTSRSPISQQAVTTPVAPTLLNNINNSPAAPTPHHSATASPRRKSLTPRSESSKKSTTPPPSVTSKNNNSTISSVYSSIGVGNSSVGSVSWVLSSLQAPAPRGQMMEAVHQLKGWIKTENNGFWTCNSAQVICIYILTTTTTTTTSVYTVN